MGNWLGIKNEGINYPMLIIDAVRDVLLNILWQSHAKWSDDGLSLMRFGLHIFEANKLLGDDVLNSTLFQAYGINPTAWAGRYTRTWAIASAKHSVIICQQMLGQTLQKGEADYDKLVAKVNDKIEAKGDPKMAWDGTIWPIGKLPSLKIRTSQHEALHFELHRSDSSQTTSSRLQKRSVISGRPMRVVQILASFLVCS